MVTGAPSARVFDGEHARRELFCSPSALLRRGTLSFEASDLLRPPSHRRGRKGRRVGNDGERFGLLARSGFAKDLLLGFNSFNALWHLQETIKRAYWTAHKTQLTMSLFAKRFASTASSAPKVFFVSSASPPPLAIDELTGHAVQDVSAGGQKLGRIVFKVGHISGLDS